MRYVMLMFETDDIPLTFLNRAAALLADTSSGMTGPKIVDAINEFAERWGVRVPHPEYPWEAPSKRAALLDSLKAFSPSQQFVIIEELCEHFSFPVGSPSLAERRKLKAELFAKHGALRPNKEVRELEVPLIEETRHWLSTYPDALRLFEDARLKYDARVFQRNLIDDLRVSLEVLLKAILGNGRSLENQLSEIGKRLKEKGASPQFRNMFASLLDYYAKFHNDHVKHDDKLPEEEIEFVFELTASFMKHLVRVVA